MENPYALDPNATAPQPLLPDDAFNRSLFALKETRPWVRFVGILTAIGAALTGIGSVVAMFAMAFGGPGFTALLVAFYAFIAVVYGFAAKFLLGYASAIRRVESTRSLDDMASALEQQKSFWKLMGVCTAIFLVLYFVFMAVMIFGSILWRASAVGP